MNDKVLKQDLDVPHPPPGLEGVIPMNRWALKPVVPGRREEALKGAMTVRGKKPKVGYIPRSPVP